MVKKLFLTITLLMASLVFMGCNEFSYETEDFDLSTDESPKEEPVEKSFEPKRDEAYKFWKEKYSVVGGSKDALVGIYEYYENKTEDIKSYPDNIDSYRYEMSSLSNTISETIDALMDLNIKKSSNEEVQEASENTILSLINANRTLKMVIETTLEILDGESIVDQTGLDNMIETYKQQISTFEESYSRLGELYEF